MRGALVLSAAGYGPAVVVDAFPTFGFPAAAAERGSGITLETSLAWRALDRRPIVKAFLDMAA